MLHSTLPMMACSAPSLAISLRVALATLASEKFACKDWPRMLGKKLKEYLNNIRPHAEKLAFDTARGYIFGSLYSVFVPSRKSLVVAMHENGSRFAKISAVFSATQMISRAARGKEDVYNTVAAGAVAGAIGSQYGAPAGSCLLATYYGASYILNK